MLNVSLEHSFNATFSENGELHFTEYGLKNICILIKKLFIHLVVIFPKQNPFQVNLMQSLKIKMIVNFETM